MSNNKFISMEGRGNLGLAADIYSVYSNIALRAIIYEIQHWSARPSTHEHTYI